MYLNTEPLAANVFKDKFRPYKYDECSRANTTVGLQQSDAILQAKGQTNLGVDGYGNLRKVEPGCGHRAIYADRNSDVVFVIYLGTPGEAILLSA